MKASDFVNIAFRNGSKRIRAAVYLAASLSNGPMYSDDIPELCHALKISRNTVLRAAKDLGVRKSRSGFGKGGCWIWELGPQVETVGVDPLIESAIRCLDYEQK